MGSHREESSGVICSPHSLQDLNLSAGLVDFQGVNMGENLDSNRNPDARSVSLLCTACTGRGPSVQMVSCIVGQACLRLWLLIRAA